MVEAMVVETVEANVFPIFMTGRKFLKSKKNKKIKGKEIDSTDREDICYRCVCMGISCVPIVH